VPIGIEAECSETKMNTVDKTNYKRQQADKVQTVKYNKGTHSRTHDITMTNSEIQTGTHSMMK